MPTFEESIHGHFDRRILTLGRVKARSLGADPLTLSALNVLVYAQLEGGVKDLLACILKFINALNLPLGELRPALLQWRNPEEIDRFRSMIDFSLIGTANPFASALSRRVRIRGINRRFELNQMGWPALKRIYTGLGLDYTSIEFFRAQIDQLVDDRNSVAHYGMLPKGASALIEKQLRENVVTVENVLTDFSLQLLPFFSNKLHRR